MKISKELLSEVLGENIRGVKDKQPSERMLYFRVQSGVTRQINIHELAHKCKEWAYKSYGLSIWSGYSFDDECFTCEVYEDGQTSSETYWAANTEPEAFFKACEWILEQKATK